MRNSLNRRFYTPLFRLSSNPKHFNSTDMRQFFTDPELRTTELMHKDTHERPVEWTHKLANKFILKEIRPFLDVPLMELTSSCPVFPPHLHCTSVKHISQSFSYSGGYAFLPV